MGSQHRAGLIRHVRTPGPIERSSLLALAADAGLPLMESSRIGVQPEDGSDRSLDREADPHWDRSVTSAREQAPRPRVLRRRRCRYPSRAQPRPRARSPRDGVDRGQPPKDRGAPPMRGGTPPPSSSFRRRRGGAEPHCPLDIARPHRHFGQPESSTPTRCGSTTGRTSGSSSASSKDPNHPTEPAAPPTPGAAGLSLRVERTPAP